MPQSTLSPKILRYIILSGMCLNLVSVFSSGYTSSYARSFMMVIGLMAMYYAANYGWQNNIPYSEVYSGSFFRNNSQLSPWMLLALLLMPLIVGLVFFVIMPYL